MGRRFDRRDTCGSYYHAVVARGFSRGASLPTEPAGCLVQDAQLLKALRGMDCVEFNENGTQIRPRGGLPEPKDEEACTVYVVMTPAMRCLGMLQLARASPPFSCYADIHSNATGRPPHERRP